MRPGAYAARVVGRLYGMNTAGAALGVLAVPFLLLNRFSLPTTLALTGAANLGLAAMFWRLGRCAEANAPQLQEPTPPVERAGAAPLLLLGAVSGLVGLAFEVCLVRSLFVQNPSSPYNFRRRRAPTSWRSRLGARCSRASGPRTRRACSGASASSWRRPSSPCSSA